MLNCITTEHKTHSIPVIPILLSEYDNWLSKQNNYLKNATESQGFGQNVGQFFLDYHANGTLSQVYLILADDLNPYTVGANINQLPLLDYHVASDDTQANESLIKSWGFSCYRFERYKANQEVPHLVVSDTDKYKTVLSEVTATHWVRDLINTPADDMGPTELAAWVDNFAGNHDAKTQHIVGDELLKQNFPAIHLVGRASHKSPRLIEMNWGDDSNPRITLVGKGVCFDTGGNNMKTGMFMKLMKKDMGGAAHVLGLAKLIIDHELPVRLQVLIPAVENAVAGNAHRQGDIVTTRSGQTVEIGHTDAEGRVILSDALTYATEFNPSLIIDFATLTGAARVALGPTLTPTFSNRDEINQGIHDQGLLTHDNTWPMPLYREYNKYIKPKIADLTNSGSIPQAGCITAALFLEHFISEDIPWIHIDTYGWNFGDRTGGIEGGEALSLVAVFHWLKSYI
ncbi:leucyl aminopeptidase family protein [Marinicella rhabdoformis]|uniref:leucyl aminopeptidase family protein n=1 Tax=Marinicella rhabdoformis TaxID=2580566 RepID=UPI0012AEC19A|nr:leucyl aminopeptidase family protein [Marinicella rhabdoformis]